MPPAAIPSNAPSIEFRRHHRVEAPAVDQREYRPGWRIKSPLDGLLAAKLITPRQWRAAVAFRAAYERAMKGAVQVGRWGAVYVDSGCRGSPAAEISERQADALDLVRRVEVVLGSLYTLLVWLVIDDFCWAEIGRRLDVDRRTAKTWCAAAVAALAVL
jgi:hypothetical protein